MSWFWHFAWDLSNFAASVASAVIFFGLATGHLRLVRRRTLERETRRQRALVLRAIADDFDQNPMPSLREVRHRVANVLRHRAAEIEETL